MQVHNSMGTLRSTTLNQTQLNNGKKNILARIVKQENVLNSPPIILHSRFLRTFCRLKRKEDW